MYYDTIGDVANKCGYDYVTDRKSSNQPVFINVNGFSFGEPSYRIGDRGRLVKRQSYAIADLECALITLENNDAGGDFAICACRFG